MDINVETITPLQAARWLETMGTNRKISKTTVARYARAIGAGEWLLNGEALKFDTNGQLIDGQHRLSAVVQANRPIQAVVVRGLNGRSFETFDSGKGRSIPDILSIYGYNYCIVLAGATRAAYIHKLRGKPVMSGRDTMTVSSSTILSFLRETPERENRLVLAAAEGSKRAVRGTFYGPTTAAYMWMVTHLADPVLADEFFAAFENTVRDDHPVSLLVNRIAVDRTKKSYMSREESLALCIKAWNAFSQNLPLKLLKYRMFGDKPDPFPEVYGLDVTRI